MHGRRRVCLTPEEAFVTGTGSGSLPNGVTVQGTIRAAVICSQYSVVKRTGNEEKESEIKLRR